MLRPTTGLRLILSPDRIRPSFPGHIHIPIPPRQSSESFQEQREAAGKFRATKITDAPCPLFWPDQFNTTHRHASSHSQTHQVESLLAIITIKCIWLIWRSCHFQPRRISRTQKCPIALPILPRHRQARRF